MADLSVFSYRPGDTRLHRLDARCKLLSLIAFSLCVLNTDPLGLFILSAAALIFLGAVGLHPVRLFMALRNLFYLLGFVWAARALFTPGTPLVTAYLFTLSREGAAQGGLICWRMMLVVLFSLVFTATTRTRRIRESIQRLLRPFPRVPGNQIAIMMGLMTRFIPAILERVGETAEAQRARALDNRKNPIYRIKKLAVPLLRGLFIDAHVLSEAMEARCYTQGRVSEPMAFRKSDWAGLAIVFCLCLISLMVL